MVSMRCIQKKKKTDCAGFSIIECLIALSIFSIGILAVATLVLSSIGQNGSARRLTEATALAEDRLEQLLALPYDNITAGESSQGLYTVSWDVTEDAIVAETKSITVTVSWLYRRKLSDVTVRHLLSPTA
jgi:prepilin-type N-terminal cleavage/methylation domain-containing protein